MHRDSGPDVGQDTDVSGFGRRLKPALEVAARLNLRNLLLGQVVPAATATATVVVTAVVLGPEGRGEVALLMVLVTIGSVVTSFGLYVQGASPSEPPGPSIARSLVVSLWLLSVTFAALVLILWLLGWYPASMGWLPPLVAIGAPLTGVVLFAQRVMQAQVGAGEYLRVAVATALVSLVALAFAVALRSATAFAVSFTVGLTALTGLVWLWFRRRVSFSDDTVTGPRSVILVLSRAWPMAVALLAQIALWRLDSALLGLAGSTEQLGLYSVAVAATSVCWILAEVVTLNAYSSAASLMPDVEAFRRRLRRLTVLAAISTLASVVAMLVILLALVATVLPEYRDSIRLFLVLSLGVVVSGGGRVLLAGAGLLERQGILRLFSVTALVGSLAYVPAIIALGATGAALAASALYCLTTLVLVPVLTKG